MLPTALSLVRYRDLREQDINVELQVHTSQTDGKHSIAEILDEAVSRQLNAIAFTEHVRHETDWFPEFAREVRAASEKYPNLRIYLGCEAKVLDLEGTLDATDEVCSLCDLVLGSVHRFPDQAGGYLNWDELDDEAFADIEFELSMSLIRHAPIHVLAHPGGMFQRRRKKAFPAAYLRQIMQVSLETQVAIEINSSYLVDLPQFLYLCEEVNPYVSIGSDVHRLDELGRCRDMLRQVRK